MTQRSPVEELHDNIELQEPFSFTKGCRTMRIRTDLRWTAHGMNENLLFDAAEDPGQERPLEDAAVASRMVDHLVRLMGGVEAPPEQYARLGLA